MERGCGPLSALLQLTLIGGNKGQSADHKQQDRSRPEVGSHGRNIPSISGCNTTMLFSSSERQKCIRLSLHGHYRFPRPSRTPSRRCAFVPALVTRSGIACNKGSPVNYPSCRALPKFTQLFAGRLHISDHEQNRSHRKLSVYHVDQLGAGLASLTGRKCDTCKALEFSTLWFGTRRSKVQILSPRPLTSNKSDACSDRV